jgi:hypothetical protein
LDDFIKKNVFNQDGSVKDDLLEPYCLLFSHVSNQPMDNHVLIPSKITSSGMSFPHDGIMSFPHNGIMAIPQDGMSSTDNIDIDEPSYIYLAYYPWVPHFLLFLALHNYLPRSTWLWFEGEDFTKLGNGITSVDIEKPDDHQEKLIKVKRFGFREIFNWVDDRRIAVNKKKLSNFSAMKNRVAS